MLSQVEQEKSFYNLGTWSLDGMLLSAVNCVLLSHHRVEECLSVMECVGYRAALSPA